MEREKEIKFFQCPGDPPITNTKVERISQKRENITDDRAEKLRLRDVTRFRLGQQQDTDDPYFMNKVVVPIEQVLEARPNWDEFQNSHTAMRKRTRDIFLRIANKLMTRLRAGRRLAKIKQRLKADGIKNREDAKRMVQEDWRTAQNVRISDNDTEDNVKNIKFTFAFQKHNALSGQLKMPLEFETNISSFKETVDAVPPINFDDMAPFDPLE